MHKAVSLLYLSWTHLLKVADSRTILKGDKIDIKQLFRLLSKKGTINILKMLKDKNKVQYKDLSTVNIGIAIATLNGRINQLLRNGLVEHHLKRTMKREEWYTLTEKGAKILSMIEGIEEIIN